MTKTQIKHFIIDLEEIIEEYAYNSEQYELARKIKHDLESLISLIRE